MNQVQNHNQQTEQFSKKLTQRLNCQNFVSGCLHSPKLKSPVKHLCKRSSEPKIMQREHNSIKVSTHDIFMIIQKFGSNSGNNLMETYVGG